MSEPDRPAWHWDEQAALRDELAEQAEAAARDRAQLEAELAAWKARAERAEQRVRELLRGWPGR